MAEAVYLLCALTSTACAALLTRAYVHQRTRLLLAGSLCFAGLALNNILLFVDLVLVPDVNLQLLRTLVALLAMSILIFSLVWERE